MLQHKEIWVLFKCLDLLTVRRKRDVEILKKNSFWGMRMWDLIVSLKYMINKLKTTLTRRDVSIVL
ncbi:hypothetical protein B4W74_09245 [Staphylococcus intermedius]|nr:hypothetical protein B5C04_08895 [Staphylococcus intermedius]PNZ51285.1 hypothetical protein CD138_09950 [Staphylococcus intermedius NCTC 11048]PCF78797.1 hypothetical protein B4W74_09245 [Staphylococcus intermedius]PCF79769.1 hypothetical protein B4W70_08885 [Staphylococcus intermedius]PCF85880.1 hypothetical protein B4W76_09050 [Staphylococcus intermedius]